MTERKLCVPCSGTGLRDDVTLCPTCNGSGGKAQPEDRDPDPAPVSEFEAPSTFTSGSARVVR